MTGSSRSARAGPALGERLRTHVTKDLTSSGGSFPLSAVTSSPRDGR
ncbi:MAG: hypothetical protein ACFNXY_05965 [Corynebacterium matruchotii]